MTVRWLDDDGTTVLGTTWPDKNTAAEPPVSPTKEATVSTTYAVTVEPDETPSPRLIARTVSLIREAGRCPLFSEPGVRLDALNAIALETGCPVYELDPVTDGENDPDAYGTAMRKNLETLTAALSAQAE